MISNKEFCEFGISYIKSKIADDPHLQIIMASMNRTSCELCMGRLAGIFILSMKATSMLHDDSSVNSDACSTFLNELGGYFKLENGQPRGMKIIKFKVGRKYSALFEKYESVSEFRLAEQIKELPEEYRDLDLLVKRELNKLIENIWNNVSKKSCYETHFYNVFSILNSGISKVTDEIKSMGLFDEKNVFKIANLSKEQAMELIAKLPLLDIGDGLGASKNITVFKKIFNKSKDEDLSLEF